MQWHVSGMEGSVLGCGADEVVSLKLLIEVVWTWTVGARRLLSSGFEPDDVMCRKPN